MSNDEVIEAVDLEPEMIIVEEIDGEDLDADALGDLGEEGFEDGAGAVEGDELTDDLVDDPDAIAPTDVASKKAADDDDEDDDLRTEDDVEADLDSILRDKLTAADDAPPEEDEEDAVVDDKTDGMERLQPRRPDETQCAQCFLLVRNSAPGCPVEDDACPLFVL
jgi:hypothetical protein